VLMPCTRHVPNAGYLGRIGVARCQPRHVANVAVGEMTITAHSQHRADAFQKNRTALNRHRLPRVSQEKCTW
jgi:hypothetical protein